MVLLISLAAPAAPRSSLQPWLLQGCLQLPFECIHKFHLNEGGGIREELEKGGVLVCFTVPGMNQGNIYTRA